MYLLLSIIIEEDIDTNMYMKLSKKIYKWDNLKTIEFAIFKICFLSTRHEWTWRNIVLYIVVIFQRTITWNKLHPPPQQKIIFALVLKYKRNNSKQYMYFRYFLSDRINSLVDNSPDGTPQLPYVDDVHVIIMLFYY